MTGRSTVAAVAAERYGPPAVLQAVDVPAPQPGRGEVAIAVKAAAVNAIDWLSRAGKGVTIPSFPAILGWDVAGRIIATGSDAAGLRVGDDVFGLLRFPQLGQAYAEVVVAPAADVAAIPTGLSYRDVAGSMVLLTAWAAMVTHARVQSGQRVLVHGAAGGVGHIAVQIASDAGAEVIGTASARNRDFLAGLGATDVADYRSSHLLDEVGPVDIVMDTRGGEDFFRLVSIVRPGGVIVTLKGQAEGQDVAIRSARIRAEYVYVSPSRVGLEAISPLLAAGRVALNIDQTFQLSDVALAHSIGERGHVRGLLALEFDR